MRMRNLLTLITHVAYCLGDLCAICKGQRDASWIRSGSIMPGVQVKLYQGDKVVKEGVTSATWATLSFLSIRATTNWRSPRPISTPTPRWSRLLPTWAPLAVTMELATMAQNVEVTETRNEISIDSDSSLSTTVLKQDFIDALPDDEDELANYLTQIAGTRGGAGGGATFIIDGFTGGRIPPKDQIQEIRISNSPFSAEFSGIGYGRTEIITKAGTGDFHGHMNFQFRDESLNARNPFHSRRTARPAAAVSTRNFNHELQRTDHPQQALTEPEPAAASYNENSDIIRATIVGSGWHPAATTRAFDLRQTITRT